MNHKDDVYSEPDRELSRRFRQMREQDVEHLPDVPGETELEQRSPVLADSRLKPGLQKIAVAAAVVVAVGVVMTRAPQLPQEDPGALYADIMSASSMTTDQFMQVSLSVSPEMTRMPRVYDIEFSTAPAEVTN